MIQEIAPKKLHMEYQNIQPSADSTILIYQDQKTLMRKDGDTICYPTKAELAGCDIRYTYLFRVDEEEYYLGEVTGDLPQPLFDAGYTFEKSWTFREAEPRDRSFAGVTGMQLADWYRSHRFCGECGRPMERDGKERMLKCPACGRTFYPTICPAVIVAVVHDGKILMSKYAGREYKRFALIAGFAETGETIEETVHREVMEEVGLPVKNLKFYKSQPWPFSDTLLMGFFCELDGEDETITLEEEELSEAGWYTPEEVPEDFEHISLTSEMMTVFKKHHGEVPLLK